MRCTVRWMSGRRLRLGEAGRDVTWRRETKRVVGADSGARVIEATVKNVR